MDKKLIIFSIIIILTTIAVSGCNEQKATETKTFEKINFKSDVLQLVDSSIDIKEDHGKIISVEATLYFKNLLNNIINVTYVIDFCTQNDDILYSKEFNIYNIPRNYRLYTPDVFLYNGANADDFDHINIKIVDYIIIG